MLAALITENAKIGLSQNSVIRGNSWRPWLLKGCAGVDRDLTEAARPRPAIFQWVWFLHQGSQAYAHCVKQWYSSTWELFGFTEWWWTNTYLKMVWPAATYRPCSSPLMILYYRWRRALTLFLSLIGPDGTQSTDTKSLPTYHFSPCRKEHPDWTPWESFGDPCAKTHHPTRFCFQLANCCNLLLRQEKSHQ